MDFEDSTMSRRAATTTPRHLLWVLSALILFHFTWVICGALAASSGPWATAEGENLATPPQFAFTLHTAFGGPYLKGLHLASNYHFLTNRPGLPGVRLEARLKDDQGQVVRVLPIPDPGANGSVYHRQSLLARWLANDQPLVAPIGEAIPAPNQPVATVVIWDIVEPQYLRAKTVAVHLVPRDRPVMRPSELSLVLARSYGRYLCREHGAARVELVRRTQEALPPLILFREDLQNAPYPELLSSFGDFPK
jgi:hypothetical protein